jgi:exonuclease III
MLVKLLFECWNVRGLGGRQKRDDVKAAVDCNTPSVLCFQETKLADISSFTASSFLPPSLRSFVFKPSVGASGGIITAWDDRLLELTHHSIDEFSISTTFSHRSDDLVFTLVNVYGPCIHTLKPSFLTSLEHIFPSFSGPVAFLGDFNLMRSPRDKSNGNFNAAEATSFNYFINNLGLLEIPLLDRQFTWSNQQNPPILARLDRFLINPEWSLALPDSTLTSLARPTSDHVPLHLEASSKAPRSTIFRMENS